MRKSDSVDQIVGARVRLRRIQLGMQRPALASAIGVSDAQLQAYESGRERLGAELLYKICRQLNVGAQFFFDAWIVDGPKINPQGSARKLGRVTD